MTTGAPIFLVSACASGEEFVAAFRRYADKNGLFIPIAAPLPAGRRGRFAVTLKDGGVMIEGEADIVSSAATPSVLHARVGMTLRFIEPDIKSKTVLVELEQARLAMKPQPPSVPPRPAQVPAEPRPVPPAIAGRIDANNRLAECVAIGDVGALVEAVPAPPPKTGGAKFVVPVIPPMGPPGRPRTPSTPPMAYPALEKKPPAAPATGTTPSSAYPALKPPPAQAPRPRTPTPPPPLVPPPARVLASTTTPGVPVAPASTAAPVSVPRTTTTSGTGVSTSPGVAVAKPSITPPSITPTGLAAANAPAITPMSITTVDVPLDVTGPAITPMSITTVNAPLDVAPAITPTSIGVVPAPTGVKASVTQGWDAEAPADAPDEPRDTVAMEPLARDRAVLAMSRTTSDELTHIPQGRDAGVFQVMVPPSDSDTQDAVADAVPEPVAASSSEGISKPNGGRPGLPPPRRTSNTGQVPITKNPTPAGAMPVVNLPAKATRLGLPIVDVKAPAQPSKPAIPLTPLVAEEKPVEPVPDPIDEPTDITSVPIIIPEREESAQEKKPAYSVPGGNRKTVMGVAVVPDGITVLPAAAAPAAPAPVERDTALMDAKKSEPKPVATPLEPVPQVSGEVLPGAHPSRLARARSPVIEEPSGDWTMVPGEQPTIIPRKSAPELEPGSELEEKKDYDDNRRLPTGDWTIARVEDSPDGWSEPSKVDLKPIRQVPIRSHTGPPEAIVAGEKPLEVTMTAKAFDIEEETKSGLKIEVDQSLVERPGTDSVDVDFSLASTQFATPQPPLGYMATPAPGSLPSAAAMQSMMPMQQAPSPPTPVPQPMSNLFAAPGVPSATITGSGSVAGTGSFPNYPQASRQSGAADLFGGPRGPSTAVINRRRTIVIAASAAAVAIAGIVVVVMVLSKSKKKATTPSKGSTAVKQQVQPPPATPDAAPMAVQPPIAADAAPVEEAVVDAAIVPVPSGDCKVEVASTPSGAEIVRDKEVIGTTPATLSLPCGEEVKLVIRKNRYASSSKTVKPTPENTKVKVALGKTMLSVKVTSSPPGATITLGGKSLGVTPAMVKLPANESSTIVLSKPGFNPDTQKFTPKQNNQSIHASLKKKGR